MSSIILRTATRYMFPPLLVFSVYLLMRGHHFPGGGFVGGLFAGSAFALYALAFDVVTARRVLRTDPLGITSAGLALAMCSGIPALVCGQPFMTGVWWDIPAGHGTSIHFGTPVLFDIGVYLVVFGVLLSLIFSLGEEER